ncbi:MAG: hypothetical protein J7K68_05275 [Candidatus Diapherotrites archaeon]|nr:hypothetical protein [Candidatus Diapherotrites archaeon]
MNISMHFEGIMEEIIEKLLKLGIAKTKAEALRLGLLELNDKYQLVGVDKELEEDLIEINRIERDIKTGKEKVYSVKNVAELLA